MREPHAPDGRASRAGRGGDCGRATRRRLPLVGRDEPSVAAMTAVDKGGFRYMKESGWRLHSRMRPALEEAHRDRSRPILACDGELLLVVRLNQTQSLKRNTASRPVRANLTWLVKEPGR